MKALSTNVVETPDIEQIEITRGISKICKSNLQKLINLDKKEAKILLQKKINSPGKSIHEKSYSAGITIAYISNKINSSNSKNLDSEVEQHYKTINNVCDFVKYNKVDFQEIKENDFLKREIDKKIISQDLDYSRTNDIKSHAVATLLERDDVYIEMQEKHREIRTELERDKRLTLESEIFQGLDDEITEVEENEDLDVPWYFHINLTKDPFGDHDGLTGFLKDDFDQILVSNDAIKFAKNYRENGKKFVLGENYLICGEYGTGKSAVLDYMHEFSAERYIIPFKINIKNRENCHAIYNVFLRTLGKLHIKKAMNDCGILDTSEIIDEVAITTSLMEIDEKVSKNKGFLIILEDLHKVRNENNALEFLGELQPLLSDFKDQGIKVSIIATGKPHWKQKLDKYPVVTSVIKGNNIITINNITPEDAALAIQKRLNYYKADKSELKIKLSHLQNVAQGSKLDSKEHKGYRIYFWHIQEKLSNLEFDAFTMQSKPLSTSNKKECELIVADNNYSIAVEKCLKLKNYKPNQRDIMIRLVSHAIGNNYVIKYDDLNDDDNKNKIKGIRLLIKAEWFKDDRENSQFIMQKIFIDLDQALNQKEIRLNQYLSSEFKSKTKIEQQKKQLPKSEHETFQNTIDQVADKIKIYNPSLIDSYNKLILQYNDYCKLQSVIKGHEKCTSQELRKYFGQLLRIQLHIEKNDFLDPILKQSYHDIWYQRYHRNEEIINYINWGIQPSNEFKGNTKERFLLETIQVFRLILSEILSYYQFVESLIKNGLNYDDFKLTNISQEISNQIINHKSFGYNCQNINNNIIDDELLNIVRKYYWLTSYLCFGDIKKRINLFWRHEQRYFKIFTEDYSADFDSNEFNNIDKISDFYNSFGKIKYFNEMVSSPWEKMCKKSGIQSADDFDNINPLHKIFIIHETTRMIKNNIFNNYVINKNGNSTQIYFSHLSSGSFNNFTKIGEENKLMLWDIEHRDINGQDDRTIYIMEEVGLNAHANVTQYPLSIGSLLINDLKYYSQIHINNEEIKLVKLPQDNAHEEFSDIVKSNLGRKECINNENKSGIFYSQKDKEIFGNNGYFKKGIIIRDCKKVDAYNKLENDSLPYVVDMNYQIMKPIAAFLNTNGGTVFLGIKDDLTIIGIEKDLKHNKISETDNLSVSELLDEFIRKLNRKISTYFKDPSITTHMDISWFDTKDKQIVYIKCQSLIAKKPTYLYQDEIKDTNNNLAIKESEKFLIRLSGETIELKGKELTDYIASKQN